jgi:hypothetical protein
VLDAIAVVGLDRRICGAIGDERAKRGSPARFEVEPDRAILALSLNVLFQLLGS